MATAVATILELQGKALYQLCAGHGEEAETTLGCALVVGMHALGLSEGQNELLPPRQETPLPELAEISMEEVLATDDWQAPPTHFDMFRFSFGISSEDLAGISSHESQLHLLVAIVAYNLAIISHESGLIYGLELSKLNKAQKLYHVAIQNMAIASHIHTDVVTPSTLELAVCNNMGYIYSFLGDSAGIIDCRDGLERLTRNAHCATFFPRSLAKAQSFVPIVAHHA